MATFLAYLMCLVVWESELKNKKFILQTDNMTALEAALQYKSRKPLINQIAAEISLRLDKMKADLQSAVHVPGALNFEADSLSTLSVGKSIPEVLKRARRYDAPNRDASFWLAWPQEW